MLSNLNFFNNFCESLNFRDLVSTFCEGTWQNSTKVSLHWIKNWEERHIRWISTPTLSHVNESEKISLNFKSKTCFKTKNWTRDIVDNHTFPPELVSIHLTWFPRKCHFRTDDTCATTIALLTQSIRARMSKIKNWNVTVLWTNLLETLKYTWTLNNEPAVDFQRRCLKFYSLYMVPF